MNPIREPFWGRPARAERSHALFLSLLVAAWFVAIYAGADWITAQHDFRVRVHLNAELAMPFVPAAVAGYLSIYGLFAMPAFVLRTRRQLQALAATLAIVILCAVPFFLLLPAQSAFSPPGEMGAWTPLVRFAKFVALTNNLLPSLHVAMATVLVLVYARRAGPLGKGLFALWWTVIAGSTLLLHQHYLLDVLTGLLLGWAGVRGVYDRWTREDAASREWNSSSQPVQASSAAGLIAPTLCPRARQRRS